MEQLLPELRDKMRFDDLLRGARGRFLPTATAERQVHAIDKLLERVHRLRQPGHAAVDVAESSGENRFRFRLRHLRTTPQHFGPPAAVLPPGGNPHTVFAVLAYLQAAFLETLSTHFVASFLRLRR
jgi:hypothetical protein